MYSIARQDGEKSWVRVRRAGRTAGAGHGRSTRPFRVVIHRSLTKYSSHYVLLVMWKFLVLHSHKLPDGIEPMPRNLELGRSATDEVRMCFASA